MNRPPLTALLALAVLVPATLLAAGARAQDRGPVERQQLLDLAFTIGESHALRQLCEGPNDQYWRSRMVRLTEVEKADQAFDAQLRDRFNTGFAAGQGQFPQCDETSRRAQQQSASKGQALSARLAQAMRSNAPTSDRAAPETVADN
uniref:TIGR02301 family protein n=1 Tax=Caulobacter sp. (strain K31) TaxID=366602 RepID=B0T048_CAUSK